jgi:1-aminocyclopropane-1-carboxylate deaminase
LVYDVSNVTKKRLVVGEFSAFWTKEIVSPLQKLDEPIFERNGVCLWMKRDDCLHSEVSGNKWRKLKYNFIEAQRLGYDSLLTFGGAYSNHIAATAAAGKYTGLSTVGIIRGDELTPHANPTLRLAHEYGMNLIFVSREAYGEKAALAERYGYGKYIVPEGGTNAFAVRGTSEILQEICEQLGQMPTYVATAAGTGGTAAGLLASAPKNTTVLAFSALKLATNEMEKEIRKWVPNPLGKLLVQPEFHFGGYAKTTPELRFFIRNFEEKHMILIEQVYTAKMLYGLFEMMKQGYFKSGETVVALHTGGLQGRLKSL